MKIQETAFILQAIDIHDYPFYYFKDKYALDMLSYYIGDRDVSIQELKQSVLGRLLQKPLLKKIMSTLPGKKLRQDQLMGYWNGEGRYFKLSLSQWGEYKKHRKDSWYQTSRPGYNLVLQINFDWAHDHDYYRLIAPDNNKDLPFVYDGHPVATKRNTLSWARIDVGLAYDEALIEEIQTDWLREVKQTASDVAESATNEDQPLKKILWYWKGDATVRSFNDYYHKMQPYFKLWDEATLAASIWFLKRELGINNIYYNTYETGNFMKRLHYNKPPRSLYTQLPRQFGFRETAKAPHFLEDEPYLKKTFRNNSALKWYILKF